MFLRGVLTDRVCSAALLAVTLCAGEAASAATFKVPDGDIAALQAAIVSSNSNSQDDLIELARNGNYTLVQPFDSSSSVDGLPIITADGGHKLVIHGNGATVERSTATNTPGFRIFHTGIGSNVTIADTAIRNGRGDLNGSGALLNTGGTVALERCTLTNHLTCCGSGAVMNRGSDARAVLTVHACLFADNTGAAGGAIQNNAASNNPGSGAVLVVTNSTFLNNRASSGAGVFNFGTFASNTEGVSATITDSTFVGNIAESRGGAVGNATHVNGQARLLLSNCTISSNSAQAGGGLQNAAGHVEVANCTFVSNSAQTGGAIHVEYDGAVTQIRNTTFSGNSAPAGGTITRLSSDSGPVTLTNNILSGATANMLYSGMFGSGFQSQGHNICNTTCSGVLTAPTDRVSTDPKLDPNGLRDNGGPTETIALSPDSPAVNSANDAVAPSHDQRHYARPDRSDIGAFEYGGAPTTVPLLSAVSRKAHGAAGMFDVGLPPAGDPGIEPRSGGNAGEHTVVFIFANEVTSVARATIVSGTGRVASSSLGADPHYYIVNLAGVANAQQLTVALTDVLDVSGNFSESVALTFGVLLGDANADRAVNSGDATVTRTRSGQSADATNFRSDCNVDGFISVGDAIITRAQSGQSIP